jgi:lipopolysaccharide transport system permease protein
LSSDSTAESQVSTVPLPGAAPADPAPAPSAASAAPHGESAAGVEEIVIRAGQAERLYWRDLWRYRELLFVLAGRDVSVHYKQTAIGVLWALIRPLSAMLVLTFVFSKVAQLDSPGIPSYMLLVFSGSLPWQLFATSLSESSNSLVVNANLISKVYFPRLVVPLSSLMVGLVDFAICFPVLLAMMAWFQVAPTWRLALLPLFLALTLLCAVSLGLWLCALNVRYRDVRYVIPFLVQFGVFLSPVPYSSQHVAEKAPQLYLLFSLNPMAGVIDGMRWCLFGPNVPAPFTEPSFYVSMLMTAALLGGGLWYFRKTERTFADVI